MTDIDRTTPTAGAAVAVAPPQRELNLKWALVLISIAQLMVVLDATIANIALPYIQTDLGISSANLPWIVTGYALAFGSLLLLGGRLGDLYGRRRVFMAGLRHLRDRVAARRSRAERDAAARRPWPAGPRRGAGLPRRPGADHHDVPGRARRATGRSRCTPPCPAPARPSA